MVEPSWVGRRVSVRRVIERADDGRLLFGDVVGDLVGLDAQTAVVDSRSGYVEVPLALVSVARLVPPSTADELALEEVCARGWRAAETDRLGGWLLRASGGFTGRANSVLPLRAPGLPLDEALERAARLVPASAGCRCASRCRSSHAGCSTPSSPSGAGRASPDVHVMTTRLDLADPPAAGAGVVLHGRAGRGVAARGSATAAGLEPAARALLARHDHAAFAAVRDDSGAVRGDRAGHRRRRLARRDRRGGRAGACGAPAWPAGSWPR